MDRPMKVACVSISRADWNALGMVAMALREQGAGVAVRYDARHDAPEVIEADGFDPIRLEPRDIVDATDVVVLVGDRYRTLYLAGMVALAAVPIAHLAGGDITEGSQDDSYRHAITKLAHLHFPTNAPAAARILQMGEEPWRVTCFGSASIDRLRVTPTIETKQATLDAITGGFLSADRPLVVVNCQPDTLAPPLLAFTAIRQALEGLPGCNVLVVGANDDPGGEIINRMASEWADLDPRVRYRANVPSAVYLSVLRYATALVGNSSSGFYEAPWFGAPAINVGDRQKGRARPSVGNVIDVPADAAAIAAAIRGARRRDIGMAGQYGNGHAAPAIAKAILIQAADRQRLLRKRFVDAF